MERSAILSPTEFERVKLASTNLLASLTAHDL